jgi:hypothetical protein
VRWSDTRPCTGHGALDARGQSLECAVTVARYSRYLPGGRKASGPR